MKPHNQFECQYAIIEPDSDCRGFSCVSWYLTKEDADRCAKYLISQAEAYRENRVLYVVSKEKFKELDALESAGMLFLN